MPQIVRQHEQGFESMIPDCAIVSRGSVSARRPPLASFAPVRHSHDHPAVSRGGRFGQLDRGAVVPGDEHGARAVGQSGGGEFTDGTVRKIRFWTAALDATEISDVGTQTDDHSPAVIIDGLYTGVFRTADTTELIWTDGTGLDVTAEAA